MTDIDLAITLLGKSDWYQAGHMDAESLMNVLCQINHKSPERLSACEATLSEIGDKVNNYFNKACEDHNSIIDRMTPRSDSESQKGECEE